MQRTARRLGVVLATTIAMATTGGVAQAAPAQTATGDVTSGPFHLVFDAARAPGAAPGAATGHFFAETKIGPLSVMKLEGPVTCLDVRGNHIGLFYPIRKATPSLLSMVNAGVFIYVTVDGRGNATAVSFLPVPVSRATSCPPIPTLVPAMGGGTASATS